MKGFVPTPPRVVDAMVAKLFRGRPPSPSQVVLDPGCGEGAFMEGVVRWCRVRGLPSPQLVGVESDPKRLEEARQRLSGLPRVQLIQNDFLVMNPVPCDFVVGNPPYVSITGLTTSERERYRPRYTSARRRFDLYLLFFEQSLRFLRKGGRLVLITPEKFLYVDSAAPLRRLLASKHVLEVELLDESTFEGLITYPAITTVTNSPSEGKTRVLLRDGASRDVRLPRSGDESWLPLINGGNHGSLGPTLRDICVRISCGVATGADDVFVKPTSTIDHSLSGFARPTIAGKQLDFNEKLPKPSQSMLLPYDEKGRLLEERDLGKLGVYLSRPDVRERLMVRTCVERKPWYSFHESPPLTEMLRPKLICKDITPQPHFWPDLNGDLVPRHSTYYVSPRDNSIIDDLLAYLNSEDAKSWMRLHCQRAANGFIRMQSNVLRRLPIPEELLNPDERVPKLVDFASG